MLVIGEKINSIVPSVMKIVKERNKEALQGLALKQISEGAQALDINADDIERASPEASKKNIKWAIKTIQKATDIPLMIDSADPRVLTVGLKVYDFSKGTPFLNSLNEKNKEGLIPLLLKYNCRVVVMVDLTARKSLEEKLETTRKLRDYLQKKNIDLEKIYIDPAVSTIGSDPDGALRVIEAIKKIGQELRLKTICAPSNVSDGAPARHLLNSVFIKMLEGAGLDAVICNPKDVSTEVPQEGFEAAKEVLEGRDRRFKKYRRYLGI